jgi:hypothetical protein
MFDSTDPLTSRSRFETRKFRNFSSLFVIFLVSVVVFSWFVSKVFPGFIPLLIVDAIVLGAIYYLYNSWSNQPIKIRCEHCDKIISSRTPWVCGVCGTKNTDTANYPFVSKCKNENCGCEPKSYRCHHCNEFIFLTEDEDTLNYAHSVNSPAEMPEPDKHAEDLKALREKKAEKLEEREIAIVEADIQKLEKLKKAESNDDRKIDEIVEGEVEYVMGLERLEATLIKKYEEEFKGNPALVKRLKMTAKAVIQSKRAARL